MSINDLSDLIPGNHDCTVHVYVSRLWQHRGASDDGPIKHTDIVFHDKEANYMYGEIAGPLVDQFIEKIEEGKIYEISRFLVSKIKNWYKPVDSEVMIRFGRYTVVKEVDDDLMRYPLCTYALTPLDELPATTDSPQSFTDVVGIITGVSSTSVYHSSSRSTPSTKRVIYLSDLSGFQVTLVLWGERALAFDADAVLQIGQGKPVVAIFVGTLVKPFEGCKGLSGGAPCRWYINEQLPQIENLLTQLKDKVPVIQGISILGQSAAEISSQVDLETKTVEELRKLDIWKHKKTRFYCTVVLTKLSPGERWWFFSCTACGGGTTPYGAKYKCPAKNCGATGGAPRYRLCYVGSDGTGEVDLMFFERAGRELLGKGPLTIMRSKVPSGVSEEEAIQFARTDQSTPRELASAVSRKFRLVVSVTTKSFQPLVNIPSYQVIRIEEQHGNQPCSAALGRRPGLVLASPSGSTSSAGGGLSPAGETLAAGLDMPHSDMDAQASTEMPASTGDSEAILLGTPPSVTKPAGLSDGKTVVSSNIRKALSFEEINPVGGTGTLVKLPPAGDSAKLPMPAAVDPASALASPPTPSEKGPKRKLSAAKSPVEGTGKKNKAGKN